MGVEVRVGMGGPGVVVGSLRGVVEDEVEVEVWGLGWGWGWG